MNLSLSAADILQNSKEAMTTMGEWELVGLTSSSVFLPAMDDEMYQEMRFFVRKQCRL